MLKHKLVDFIIQFMEEVDKEISEMKLFVCFPSASLLPDPDLHVSVERQSEICRRILLDPSKTFFVLSCNSVSADSF